jgi:hypothetical protein
LESEDFVPDDFESLDFESEDFESDEGDEDLPGASDDDAPPVEPRDARESFR